jgi:YHS domain-containing protein
MTKKSIPALLASLLLSAGVLSAAAAKTDAEIIAAARKAYPLKTCLVSNEPLGSMGEASGYIYRAKGQPDRVVFFCCEGCGDDFKANPAKFLAKVDAAAAQAAKSGKRD